MVMMVGGCDDEPVGIQPKTVTGEVDLYDELGNPLSSAGEVRVAALSISSIQQYQTFTDASGRFELELPEEETVPLMFSREGYGDMFFFGVESATEPVRVRLFARSSARPTKVTAVAKPCGTFPCIEMDMDVENFFGPGVTRRLFRFFLSTDPGVSYYDYEFTNFLVVVPDALPGFVRDGSDATFHMDGIHGALGSFTTGQTVHMVVYGATENLASEYPQPDTGLPIYTDLSTVAARASFIMP